MKIKLSKSQWEMIGKKAGWMKKAISRDTIKNIFDSAHFSVIRKNGSIDDIDGIIMDYIGSPLLDHDGIEHNLLQISRDGKIILNILAFNCSFENGVRWPEEKELKVTGHLIKNPSVGFAFVVDNVE